MSSVTDIMQHEGVLKEHTDMKVETERGGREELRKGEGGNGRSRVELRIVESAKERIQGMGRMFGSSGIC